MPSMFATTATAALFALAVAGPSLVATVLGALYIRYVRGTARQALIDKAISRAFYVVEDLKAQGRLPKLAEKPAIALEQLHELLSVDGITLTDELARGAKLVWSAMHSPDTPVQTVNAKAAAGFSAEPPAPPSPTARRVGFFVALLAVAVCLPQAACVTGWTAAEKAAPRCYGIDATSFTTLVNEGKQIATTTATGCSTGNLALCAAAVETDLGTFLANQALESQAWDCVTEAIALELRYPNGGEAPYVPDAGPSEQRLPLERAIAMTPEQQSALEGVAQLQAHHGGVR